MTSEQIGAKIREWRISRQVSQARLAKHVAACAKAFNVSVSDFLHTTSSIDFESNSSSFAGELTKLRSPLCFSEADEFYIIRRTLRIILELLNKQAEGYDILLSKDTRTEPFDLSSRL